MVKMDLSTVYPAVLRQTSSVEEILRKGTASSKGRHVICGQNVKSPRN